VLLVSSMDAVKMQRVQATSRKDPAAPAGGNPQRPYAGRRQARRRYGPTSMATWRARRNRNDLASPAQLASNNVPKVNSLPTMLVTAWIAFGYMLENPSIRSVLVQGFGHGQ
jgi:hypothetical protein